MAGLEAGDYTSEQLTILHLAQIATYESTYNAFTFMNDNALAQARASDRKRKAGKKLGAMEGVPVAIKEVRSFYILLCSSVACPSTHASRACLKPMQHACAHTCSGSIAIHYSYNVLLDTHVTSKVCVKRTDF